MLGFQFGRPSRNRTYINGFGDRCTTIVLWTYLYPQKPAVLPAYYINFLFLHNLYQLILLRLPQMSSVVSVVR